MRLQYNNMIYYGIKDIYNKSSVCIQNIPYFHKYIKIRNYIYQPL